MDKETIIDYVTKTPANTNKAVLSGMLDGIAQGGGSSDFSTAEVTFINSVSGKSYQIEQVPIINETYGVIVPRNIEVEDSVTVSVPLYKGKAFIQASADNPYGTDTQVMPTFTGGVSISNGGLLITGDGSATFAGTMS